MCVVSFVSDHYGKWPTPDYPNDGVPAMPLVPMQPWPTTWPIIPAPIDWTKAAPASLPWTKATLKKLKRILKDLKDLDTALGLSDCEDPKKAEWMKTIETWVDRLEAEKKRK